jgi:predicted AAA+ superfamily ATPase
VLRVQIDRVREPGQYLLLGSASPALLAQSSESLVLAATDRDSMAWRESFIRLTVERDLAALGLGAAPSAVRRFWNMLAH